MSNKFTLHKSKAKINKIKANDGSILKVDGKPIIEIRAPKLADDEEYYTKDDIESYCQQINEKYKDANKHGFFSLAVRFPNNGTSLAGAWRSSNFIPVGQRINVPEVDIDSGGNQQVNDTNEYMSFKLYYIKYDTPEQVDESKAKPTKKVVNKQAKKQILKGGSLSDNVKVFKPTKLSREDDIVVYRLLPDKVTYELYFDDSTIKKMHYNNFNDFNKQHLTTFIPYDKSKTKSSFEEFAKYIHDAQLELYQATNGRINLKLTGSFSDTAMNLFYEMSEIPERMSIKECQWIDDASTGALIYLNQSYTGIGFKYDFVSRYPAIMRHKNFKVPFGAPRFIRWTQWQMDEKDFVIFGLYKCIITTDKPDKRLFRFNDKNVYTSIDINRAKQLHYTIKMIDTDENVMLYDDKHVKTGEQVFKQFVDYVFNLKQKKVKGAKEILNSLWGTLVEKNKIKFVMNQSKEHTMDINDTKIVIGLKPIGDVDSGLDIATSIYEDNQFKTPFARMKPFLLASARSILSSTVEQQVDKVVSMHTDGFIMTEPLIARKSRRDSLHYVNVVLPHQKSIGDLVFEAVYDDISFTNKHQVIGTPRTYQ